MKWRWEGDTSLTLGVFILGFLGVYIVMAGVEAEITALSMPAFAALGGFIFSLTAWLSMFAIENLKYDSESPT